MANLGEAVLRFKGDTQPIKKDAQKLNGDLKKILSTTGIVVGGLASVAKTALIGITSNAVKMQGELEQQIGGTEAVFKKYAKTIQTDAANAFDKMGISANNYMAYINKMGSLMKGSGLSTKKAMDLSSQAMQRAADVASIMGISVDDAMTAISGAAKGNFTMMDNLGVAMNASSLSAYALSKGIKKTYSQMSQGEKVELAMQMFLEKSSYAAGNYAKENQTLAGSLTTLKAAAQNFMSGAGNMDQVISALTNFAKILVSNLKTILPQIALGLVSLINAIFPMLPDLIKALLPSFVKGVTDLTIGLIGALPQIITLIAEVLPDLIPQIVDAIMLIIPALIENLPLFLEAGLDLVLAIAKGVLLGVVALVKNIGALCIKAIDKLKEKFAGKSPLEIGKDLVKGLWNGIKNAKDWVLDKIKGFGKSVLDGIKSIFGISSPSKEFEIIGRYNIQGLEQGMEKESLKLQSGFEEMFSLSPNLYGTSSTNLSPIVNVTNNISMKQNSLGQMVNDIKTFSGGAKNDYSYGMGA